MAKEYPTPLTPVTGYQYRRYTPSAYDSSMNVYEELVMIREYLNQMIIHFNENLEWSNENFKRIYKALDDMIKEIESFEGHIINVVMPANIVAILNEWFDNGKLAEIINEQVFDMKADTTYVNEQLGIVNKKFEHYQEVVYPEHFGAKGDGITDDYAAIKNAIAFASANKLPLVFREGKVYIVNTKEGANIFNITAPIEIRGKGTIRLGMIGDYETVFNLRENASDVKITQITIDENTRNNVKTINTGTQGNRRITINAWNGAVKLKNILIQDIHIYDCLGVWQITMLANDVKVYGNTVTYAVTGDKPTYDRTSVYMAGANWWTKDNTMNGSPHAHTCFETHGTNINLLNNFAKDWDSCLYIVNDRAGALAIDNVNISGNTFITRHGMRLWMEVDGCNVEEVIIDNNTIVVTENAPAFSTYDVTGQDNRIDSVKFTNNIVKLNSAANNLIQLRSTSGKANTVYNNFVINGNTFKGSCQHAIRLEVQPSKLMTIKELEISDNNFDIDTLNSDRLIFMTDVNVGFENVVITSNTFKVRTVIGFDNYRIIHGSTANRTQGLNAVKLIRNNYIGSNFTFANSEGKSFLHAEETLSDILGVTGIIAYSGFVRDIKGQSMSLVNGAGRSRIIYGNARPTSGDFTRGDIMWNTDMTPSGKAGWVCIATGSGGATWKPFGVIDA